jgi:hypothetical protein
MGLQFLTLGDLEEPCCLEPTRCEGEFDRTVNSNETVTLWKSTEPAKGTFYIKLSTDGTPEGATAIFTIKKADGTTISRRIGRGTAYALTVDQVVEVTVRVKYGSLDQTASIGFSYCDQNIVEVEICEKQCCPIPFACQALLDFIFQLGAQPLFTWETFFPVKGVIQILFISTYNPLDHPRATILVERFKQEDIIKTISLNVTKTGPSVVPFILAVDDIKKVTVSVLGVQENQSSASIILCYQEEINSFCCDDPFKCDAFIGFGQSTPTQSINIWKTIMPVKGTYSITNFYDQEATVTIRFFNGDPFKKTLERFGGFGITANDVKDITIRLEEQSTQEGSIEFQYCVQDIPTHQSCRSSCCPHPLQCSNIGIQSYNNPQGQKIPLWISKVPLDGEILFLVKGKLEQRTKLMIKRYGKPDIIKIFEAERIFIVRTTDLKSVVVQFENGDPNDNLIELRLCIQDQVSQKDTMGKGVDRYEFEVDNF